MTEEKQRTLVENRAAAGELCRQSRTLQQQSRLFQSRAAELCLLSDHVRELRRIKPPPFAVIHPDHLSVLANAASRAFEEGDAGHVLTGYLILYKGLLNAEADPDPDIQELRERWEEALREYKTRFPRNWDDGR